MSKTTESEQIKVIIQSAKLTESEQTKVCSEAPNFQANWRRLKFVPKRMIGKANRRRKVVGECLQHFLD